MHLGCFSIFSNLQEVLPLLVLSRQFLGPIEQYQCDELPNPSPFHHHIPYNFSMQESDCEFLLDLILSCNPLEAPGRTINPNPNQALGFLLLSRMGVQGHPLKYQHFSPYQLLHFELAHRLCEIHLMISALILFGVFGYIF